MSAITSSLDAIRLVVQAKGGFQPAEPGAPVPGWETVVREVQVAVVLVEVYGEISAPFVPIGAGCVDRA